MQSLKNLSETQKDMQAQIKTLAQSNVEPALKEAINELTTLIPQLTAVKWNQYTPHFNDGDVCEFGVNEVSFKLNDATEGGDYDNGWNDVSSYSTITNGVTEEGLTKSQNDALVAFQTNLYNIDSMLEEAFGDGYEITLSPKSIEVEEYSHD